MVPYSWLVDGVDGGDSSLKWETFNNNNNNNNVNSHNSTLTPTQKNFCKNIVTHLSCTTIGFSLLQDNKSKR